MVQGKGEIPFHFWGAVQISPFPCNPIPRKRSYSQTDRDQSAVEIYPSKSLGLSDYKAYLGFSSRKAYDNGRTMARQALQLDPQNAEAHISLATVDMLFFRNFSEAESEIQEGLTLDPSYAYGHQVASWFNLEMGRMQEAIVEGRKAVELDPLSPFYNAQLADTYYHNRDYARTIEQENKTLEIDPKYAPAAATTARAYRQMQRPWSNGSSSRN
jgi:tetratricopeptide (TPR) repeat protein